MEVIRHTRGLLLLDPERTAKRLAPVNNKKNEQHSGCSRYKNKHYLFFSGSQKEYIVFVFHITKKMKTIHLF